MPYLFKEKFKISDLVDLQQSPKHILIYHPNDELAELYSYYLTLHNFRTQRCFSLQDFSSVFSPQLLIYSLDDSTPTVNLNRLKNFRQHHPESFILTLGFNTDAEHLKQLLSSGVSSHLNRRHSRPEDIVVIAKTLLNN